MEVALADLDGLSVSASSFVLCCRLLVVPIPAKRSLNSTISHIAAFEAKYGKPAEKV